MRLGQLAPILCAWSALPPPGALRAPRAIAAASMGPSSMGPSSSVDAEQLAVLSLPTEPSPELSPADVVYALCSGLKHAHVPQSNDGLRRVCT
jgi:hypothetical protein